MRDRQQGARRSVTSRIRITSLYTPNEKSLSRWLARSYRETVRVLFAVTAATGGKLLTALDSVVVSRPGIEPTARPMRSPESDYSRAVATGLSKGCAVSVSASGCRPSAVMAMRRRAQCLSIDAQERPLLISIPKFRAPDQYVCKVSDGLSVQRVRGLTRVPQRPCVCRLRHRDGAVRHIETNCTGAQQNGGEQTGEGIEKTGANRSGPKPTIIQTPLSGPRYRGSNPCLPARLRSPSASFV